MTNYYTIKVSNNFVIYVLMSMFSDKLIMRNEF